MMPPPPPGSDDVTIGELYRALTQFRNDVHEDFAAVHARIDGIRLVHPDTYAADKAAMEQRVSANTSDIKQVVKDRRDDRRLIWTSLIAPVLMLVVGLVVAGLVAS